MSFAYTLTGYKAEMVVGIAMLIWYILIIASGWKIFTKMGVAGWKALIPIYSTIVLYDRIWQRKMAMWLYIAMAVGGLLDGFDNVALSLISMVANIAAVVIFCIGCNKLAKSFGKGMGYTIGLIILTPIFELLLGFGGSRYIGNTTEEAR